MIKKSQSGLEVFCFSVNPYHLAVDISQLESVKETYELIQHEQQVGFKYGDYFEPVKLVELNQLLNIKPDDKAQQQILLLKNDQILYGIHISKSEGIIPLRVSQLFLIPKAIKALVPSAFWAVGYANKRIIILIDLLNLIQSFLQKSND